MVTKSLDDFGIVDVKSAELPESDTRILRIPAPLLCYWMGQDEIGEPGVDRERD